MMGGYVAPKNQIDRAMLLSDVQRLFEHVRRFNMTGGTEARQNTPRVRQLIPHIDARSGQVSRVEILHGSRRVLKNFEVRFCPEGVRLYDEIMRWLDTPLKPLDVFQREQRNQELRQQQEVPKPSVTIKRSKIGTPEDPFYNPMV